MALDRQSGTRWEREVDSLMEDNNKKALAEAIARALMLLDWDRPDWVKVRDVRDVLRAAHKDGV